MAGSRSPGCRVHREGTIHMEAFAHMCRGKRAEKTMSRNTPSRPERRSERSFLSQVRPFPRGSDLSAPSELSKRRRALARLSFSKESSFWNSWKKAKIRPAEVDIFVRLEVQGKARHRGPASIQGLPCRLLALGLHIYRRHFLVGSLCVQLRMVLQEDAIRRIYLLSFSTQERDAGRALPAQNITYTG